MLPSDPEARFADGRDGFTLVEMLVTLSILSLLSMVLIGTITQLKPLGRIGSSNNAEMELAAAANFVEATLGEARRLPLLQSNPDRRTVFEGSRTSSSFAAVVRVASGQFALRDVTIAQEGNDGRSSIIRKDTPRRLAGGSVSSYPIIENVGQISFSYLAATQGMKPQWSQDWQNRQKLPHAVRFRLTMTKGNVPRTIERTVMLLNAD